MSKTESSKETKRKREKEIISAAREVFKRYGYRKTTMVDIAKEVDLNQATLYHYFKNKEDIFIEKLLADHEEFRESRLRKIDEESSIQHKVTMFFGLKFDFFYSNHIYEQIAELNLKKISEEHRRKLESLGVEEQLIVKGLLDSAVQSGELSSSIDTVQLTRILFRIFQGIRLEHQFNYFLSRLGPQTELMTKEMGHSIQYIFDNLRM